MSSCWLRQSSIIVFDIHHWVWCSTQTCTDDGSYEDTRSQFLVICGLTLTRVTAAPLFSSSLLLLGPPSDGFGVWSYGLMGSPVNSNRIILGTPYHCSGWRGSMRALVSRRCCPFAKQLFPLWSADFNIVFRIITLVWNIFPIVMRMFSRWLRSLLV